MGNPFNHIVYHAQANGNACIADEAAVANGHYIRYCFASFLLSLECKLKIGFCRSGLHLGFLLIVLTQLSPNMGVADKLLIPVPTQDGKSIHYIDEHGKPALEATFSSSGYFTEMGYALAKPLPEASSFGGMGIIDTTGQFVIESDLNSCELIKDHSEYFPQDFLDQHPATCDPFFYQRSKNSRLLTKLSPFNGIEFITLDEKVAFKKKFEAAGRFWGTEVAFAETQNGDVRLINEDGEFVGDAVFSDHVDLILGNPFGENNTAIALEKSFWSWLRRNKWGYINLKGDWVVEPSFDKAFPFTSAGVAIAKVEGDWWVIAEDGNMVSKTPYQSLYKFEGYDYYGVLQRYPDGRRMRGIVDADLNTVVPAWFETAIPLPNGLFRVKSKLRNSNDIFSLEYGPITLSQEEFLKLAPDQ